MNDETANAPTTLASGLRFPEGPVALDDGSVLVVEIARGTLSRVSPDGAVDVVAETGGGPNGAAMGPDGQVLHLQQRRLRLGGAERPRLSQRPGGGLPRRAHRARRSPQRRRRSALRKRGRHPLARPRTTSSSTPTAASGSRTTARRAPANATAPASSTPRRTAPTSRKRSFRWKRRTHRPLAGRQRTLRRGDPHRTPLGLPLGRARAAASGTRRSARRRGAWWPAAKATSCSTR